MMSKLSILSQKSYFTLSIWLLLMASAFLFIYFLGVNVLFLDEWAFVPLVEASSLDGISFKELFQPHNEHRVFFPKLFYVILAPFTKMNSLLFMYFNAVLISLESLIFYLLLKKQFKFNLAQIPFWLIIIPLFVFNFRQWENLLWAFQIAFYIVLLSSLICLFLLDKIKDTEKFSLKFMYLLAAITLGIIATYSCAMGFLIWIAGAIQLVLQQDYKKNNSTIYLITLFILTGIGSFYFYMKGLDAGVSPDLGEIISHPIEFVRFFFALISMISIKFLKVIGFPIGIAFMGIFLFALFKSYKNNRLVENSIWFGLSTFSLLFSVITTMGRFSYSLDHADRSRYTVFTVLFIISTFILVYDNYRYSSNKTEAKFFNYFFIGLILFSLCLDAIGIVYGKMAKKERIATVEIIKNHKDHSVDELLILHPWVRPSFITEVEESIPFVEKNEYNVFSK